MESSSRKPVFKPAYATWAALFVMLVLFASGCTSQEPPAVGSLSAADQDATQQFQGALLTATFAFQSPTPAAPAVQTPVQTAPPTFTPQPTQTASPTPYSGPPPPLPQQFTTDLLRSGTIPLAYIEDTCTFLKARWDAGKSAPGTAVMPVMFHGITEDTQVLSDRMDVHHEDMVAFVERARELGFETITTGELVGFLEENARIPPLSLIIILDDRRPGGVREHFMPYLERYDWTLTLAWLIGDTDTKPASYLSCCPEEDFATLWEQMEGYQATGYLDIQSHGNVHNINITELSSDEYILSELNESRRIIQEHFYCKDAATGKPDDSCQTDQPLAFIWPGGSFTPRAVGLARENGYRVGFTVNPRGPVMFNWIPQAEEHDPASPAWIAEGPAGDPLMTLPRYWSYDAFYRLDDVVRIAQEAQEAAAAVRQDELNYYQVYCQEAYGEIPIAASGTNEEGAK